MEIQPDGSILIRGSLDGPFTPVNKVSKLIQDFYPKKIRSIETSSPTLLEHTLEHGRPATQDDAVRQETIKHLIQQLRTKNPGLTFKQAWDRLQSQHPDLFKTDF